jgi:hypothetical protein
VKPKGGRTQKKTAADRSRARAAPPKKRKRSPPSPRTRRDARHSTADPRAPNEFEQWQAARTPREKRVDEVVELMAAGQWRSGHSHRALAARWGVVPGTVEHIAAEANRLLRHAFRAEPEARAEILAQCLLTFDAIRQRMLANGTPSAMRVALEATEAFGRYMGVEPPKNVKLSTSDEFESLTDEQLEQVATGGIAAVRGFAKGSSN